MCKGDYCNSIWFTGWEIFGIVIGAIAAAQGCILLTYLSVIFSKGVQKFAQKCQYLTLIDPLDNFYITSYFRTNQRWAGISVFQLDPIANPKILSILLARTEFKS